MSRFQLSKITKLLPAITPFICLAIIVVLQGQEYKKSAQNRDYANYLSQENQQAKSIRLQQQSPNLGFDNLAANWTYLNFVQYFGDANARETIGYRLVPEYFITIANIDPRFTQAYLRLSIANSMYAAEAEKTVVLMNQILASVDPKSEESALLWTSKGLDELLFLGNKEAAINSYKNAAQWANLSQSNRPDGLTIKDLEQALAATDKIDLKEAQIRAWSSVLSHVRDYQKQKDIRKKIDNLKSELLVLEQTSNQSLEVTD